MAVNDDSLLELVQEFLEGEYVSVSETLGETTLELAADNYHRVCQLLHERPEFKFEQLVDLCGVDYSAYPEAKLGKFAVVAHLLSYSHNQRLRLRTFLEDDEFPVIESVNDIWKAANWYEREAFDLFGIIFTGHPDLRRILTDYGFVGHPFRKDFPMVGNVEMRYDPKQKRVIYQPVSIKERVLTPKIKRVDT